MKGDREKCIEAGAWDYLSKPVDPEQMLTVLASLAVGLIDRCLSKAKILIVDDVPDKLLSIRVIWKTWTRRS